MNPVWSLNTTVKASAKSDFPIPINANLLVECLIPTLRIEGALRTASESFHNDGYRMVDVWQAQRFDLDDWDFDTYPIGEGIWEKIKRIAESQSVHFGPFFFASN